jgi:hypothetical protein
MKRSDEPAKRAITAINLEIDRRASVGANSELSDFQSAVRTALGEHWKWFVFQGIVMLALGCLAVAEPVIASVAAGIYIGWLFLFSGLLGLVTMFSAHDASAFFWILLTSALSLAVGILLIWKPDEGTVSLTLVLTLSSSRKAPSRSEPRSPIAMSCPVPGAVCSQAESRISFLRGSSFIFGGSSLIFGRRVRVGRSALSWAPI